MKLIRLHKTVQKLLEAWPVNVKVELADLFALLASGKSIGMPKSRPMPGIANGVHELRITERSGQFRVFYFIKQADAILVFHAFKKKTQTTPKHEIELAKEKLRDLL